MALGLLLTACVARAEGMVPLAQPLPDRPRADEAIVVFVRPSLYARRDLYRIYHDTGALLGVISARSWFFVRLRPGEHAFYADGENTSALRASVLPGRTYYVEVMSRFGVLSSRVQLKAIAPRFERWQYRYAWLAEATAYASYPRTELDEDARDVIRGGREMLSKYDAEELDERTLQPEDGR